MSGRWWETPVSRKWIAQPQRRVGANHLISRFLPGCGWKQLSLVRAEMIRVLSEREREWFARCNAVRWRIERDRLRSICAIRVTERASEERHTYMHVSTARYPDERKRESAPSTCRRRSLSPNNALTRAISFLLYCVTSSRGVDATRGIK